MQIECQPSMPPSLFDDKMNSSVSLESLYIRIRSDKFYYLKFILEAYEGLGILSSSGIHKEIVLLRFPREQRHVMFSLLSSIAHQINPYTRSTIADQGKNKE